MLRTSAREDTCWLSRRSATSSSSSCQPPGPSRWHHPTSSDHPSSLKAQQNSNTWNKCESYLKFKEFPSLNPANLLMERPEIHRLFQSFGQLWNVCRFLASWFHATHPQTTEMGTLSISHVAILLMEEILHHLGCRTPCKLQDIHHINWLAGFLKRQPTFWFNK